jgi:hypothetical protein
MPTITYHRVDRRKPQSLHLLKCARQVTSQRGEDGIIERIFELIGTGDKWCAEFGAWDGKHLSNTWNLINNHGFSGVLIEGSVARFQDLLRSYGSFPRAHCVNRIVSFEPGPDCLDSIFATTPMRMDFDLISIDIDGNDYHVWNSLKDYCPRVVVIEFNDTIPNDVVFVQDMDIGVNQGCSLLALIELGKEKGYELACVTYANAIFVRNQEFPKIGIDDNSIDAMHRSRIEPKMFQGYDGTIFNVGWDRPQWKLRKRKISPTAFQILPPGQRKFAGGIERIAAQEAGGSGGAIERDVPPQAR